MNDNRRITEYKATIAEDVEFLNTHVQALLKDGWQPLGGLTMTMTEASAQSFVRYEYGQAMVRYN